MDAKDFAELVIRHGWPVVFAVVGYRLLNLIFDWLSRVEPSGMFRALFNRRRQHLEKMLTLPYLARETRNLARAELNQLSRKKLTGFSNPRLQEPLIEICRRFSLRPRYFTRWRSYLTEKNGRVIFASRLYRFVWRFFIGFNLPVSTLYMGYLCYLLTQIFGDENLLQIFGDENLLFILLANMSIWYLPWLFMTAPMAPPPTAEMEGYISRYNASREASEGPVKPD